MANDGGTGAMGQEAAATVLSGNKRESRKGRIPFEVVDFSLPNKREVYPADENGNVTERTAQALIRIQGTELYFTANISRITNKAGENMGYKATLPSTGKVFFRPVFSSKDPHTNAALILWKDELVTKHYANWVRAQKADGVSLTAPAQASGLHKLDI